MLQADGQQAIQLPCEAFAIAAQRGDLDPGGAGNRLIKAGHRETALIVLTQVGVDNPDLGVDKNQRLVALLRYIDYQDTFMYVYLGGSQADAGGLVHGFEHIVYEAPGGIAHLFDRFRPGP